MSLASLELRSSTIASSSARTPSLKGGSCHFSVICIVRSPVPGSSHFPLALLMRQPLTTPGPRAVIDGLPAEVQETIASARAPATRKLYSSKWGVFESWCLTRAIDPVNCPVDPVLEFLQERLTAGAAATTLRVYVAAIAARRELDEIPLGRHRMVSAFMRGARTP